MLTGDQELLDRARIVSLHGMNREAWSRYAAGGKWAYDIVEPGFKYNMTDIQAALGLQQLKRFEWMQARRADIVRRYNEAFSSASFITRQLAATYNMLTICMSCGCGNPSGRLVATNSSNR